MILLIRYITIIQIHVKVVILIQMITYLSGETSHRACKRIIIFIQKKLNMIQHSILQIRLCLWINNHLHTILRWWIILMTSYLLICWHVVITAMKSYNVSCPWFLKMIPSWKREILKWLAKKLKERKEKIVNIIYKIKIQIDINNSIIQITININKSNNSQLLSTKVLNKWEETIIFHNSKD